MLKQLVNAHDARGIPIIKTINLEMVCQRCKRAGRELTCKHMLGQLPRWQKSGRHKDIQALMETHESTFLVEMRGIESDQFIKPAFDVGGVKALAASNYVHDGSDISHIFIGIDPAAGGALSDYAVVSAFYTSSDQLIICGAEAGAYRENTQCMSLVINHAMAVRRRIPGASEAIITIVPESNLAFEALWLSSEVRRSGLRRHCVMKEDDNRAGVKTNKELKHAMALALNVKIVRRNVKIYDDFVSIGDGSATEDVRDKFVDQIAQYSRIVKPPRDPHHGASIVSYSGKSGQGHDDMAIAIQLLNVMRERFVSDDKYEIWRPEQVVDEDD